MNTTTTTQRKAAGNHEKAGHRSARIINEVIDSKELLGSEGKVVIEHESMRYELRLTRQGKLLLTK